LSEVFETFNRHGWYWGAEFIGDSVDSMHFEWSEESVGRRIGHYSTLALATRSARTLEKALGWRMSVVPATFPFTLR
jgi:hypothetical protein